MEFQQVWVGLAVVLVGMLSIFGLISFWNQSYGTTVSAGFNGTEAHTAAIVYATLNGTGIATSNATMTQSGSGSISTTANLVQRGLNIITLIPQIMGLPGAMMSDAATIMGIPPVYVFIATMVFLFGFALLIAYLVIIGARRII